MKIYVFFINLFFYIPIANAYLDPGTGSMLLSVFIGLMSSAYFGIRKFPELLRRIFFRSTKRVWTIRTFCSIICITGKNPGSQTSVQTDFPFFDEINKRIEKRIRS